MCSEFNSSSSLIVLPKCSFLSRPILDFQDECQNSPPKDSKGAQSQEDQRQQDTHDDELQVNKIEDDLSEDVEDSCLKIKTPTSPERIIKQMICPPAPKKPKSIQATKRKQRVFLDVFNELESMFPPALLADLGNKIKKVRKESSIL